MKSLPIAPLLAMLAALPVQALTLNDLSGRWRGEGQYLIADEPPQRLRCQMRGTPSAQGVVVIGRCATAQGGQSFAWALSDLGGGRIRAEDRAPVTDEAGPPPTPLEGRITPQGLRFENGDDGHFELSVASGGLFLRLAARDNGRPVRAEARMVPEG